MASTRSQPSSMLPLSPATTLLRWKSAASSLALAYDLLTSSPHSALGNSYTPLDISICSPHAQQAGPDWTRFRLAAKLDYDGPHLPSLLRQNIPV